MPATESTRRPDPAIDGADADDEADALRDEDEGGGPDEELDDLAGTGVDLSEASELDADNVLADEESSRVLQAPD